MEVKRVTCWEELKLELGKVVSEVERKKKTNPELMISEPLFRGHSDSNWELCTTLERATGEPEYPTSKYKEIIRSICPTITDVCGSRFENSQLNFSVEKSKDFPDDERSGYMAYLRHCGFPSPLLDWTASPYMAAFFAFSSRKRPKSGEVAIYSYRKYPEGFEEFVEGEARIHGIGPCLKAGKRHMYQQSEYTLCKKNHAKGDVVYGCHKDVFDRGKTYQDIVVKYEIEYDERKEVLADLALMGINNFSLFQTEESLMNYLAWKYFK